MSVQQPMENEAPDTAPSALERLASFRFAYLAIFAFLVAYAFTIQAVETVLGAYFHEVVVEATDVDPENGPVSDQIRERLREGVERSHWVRWGDVRVRPLVLASDGRTILYADAAAAATHMDDVPDGGASLLPAAVDVAVAVPHNSLLANAVLVLYAATLIAVLAIYTRRLAGTERRFLEQVSAERDALASRAQGIEGELSSVRARLEELEPENALYSEEIDALARERGELLERLGAVEQRETTLREQSGQARELAEERAALEELLEEATQDLESKEGELEELRGQVRRATRGGRASREQDLLERRFRTLYKQLEVDGRAIDDFVGLGDESVKLRAEEAMKRLSDETEQAAVRRKVGGLPPHLSIFEIGFAGKGRLYYTRGQTRRYRVLAIGAKNSQKADLEYLSRLPKGT